MRNSLAALCLCLAATPAPAHVTIAPASAPPGTRLNATFRIGHGCSTAAPVSTGLQVEISPSVSGVETAAPPGWTVALVRAGNRITAVTWKGGQVKEGQVMLFPMTFTPPRNEGPLAFPAVQFCGDQKAAWNELPRAGVKSLHPVPLLTLTSAPAPAVTALTVHDGWFRALPGNIPAGGYFIISNSGKDKRVLTGAESPACGMMMMHRSNGDAGMASMQHVQSLDVPAGGNLTFAPIGYHLMCMEPKATMKPGNSVPVTFSFQGGAKLTATFAVRNAAGR